MEELIDHFDVTTDDGRQIRLFVYQQIIKAGTLDDPSATIRGLLRVEDERGHGVNVTSPGVYEILSEGVSATGRRIREVR